MYCESISCFGSTFSLRMNVWLLVSQWSFMLHLGHYLFFPFLREGVVKPVKEVRTLFLLNNLQDGRLYGRVLRVFSVPVSCTINPEWKPFRFTAGLALWTMAVIERRLAARAIHWTFHYIYVIN